MKIIETHIVPAIEKKIRLQEYAVSVFQSITTRSGIKKAVKREEILIDGKVAQTSNWIREGQKIELLSSQEREKKIFSLQLDVLYEDDELAVLDKPAGYPTSGNYYKTIENALPYNLSRSEKSAALPSPLPVHRLDNPTSGLLLVAKTRSALVDLHQAFQNKKVRKTYLALVCGKHPSQAVYSKKIEDKPAKTVVEKLKWFSVAEEDFSLLQVQPETGRTHQIRIHLAESGFPIVGDKQYGRASKAYQKSSLFLAAIGLGFAHPTSAKPLSIKLPLPQKFLRALEAAENP